jgi:hypothetical protein
MPEVRVRRDPEKLVRSPSIVVCWDRETRPPEINVFMVGPQPREKERAWERLRPAEARKLARALLRAANEVEGRPVPRLADASETPGVLVNLRS